MSDVTARHHTYHLLVPVAALALIGAFLLLQSVSADDRTAEEIEADAEECVLAIGFVFLTEVGQEMFPGMTPQTGQQEQAEDSASDCAEHGDVTADDILREMGYDRRDDGTYKLGEPFDDD